MALLTGHVLFLIGGVKKSALYWQYTASNIQADSCRLTWLWWLFEEQFDTLGNKLIGFLVERLSYLLYEAGAAGLRGARQTPATH